MLSRRYLSLIGFLVVASVAHAAANWVDRTSVTASVDGGSIQVWVQEDIGDTWRPEGNTIIRFRAVHTGSISNGSFGALSVVQTKTGQTWDMSHAGGNGGPAYTGQEWHTLSGPGRLITLTARLYISSHTTLATAVFDSSVPYTPPLTEQNVTVSFVGTEWTVGKSKSGTASGAQGGNQYNFAIVSGDASIGGNSSTGAFTITANGPGAITFKVWASEGNGYARSNDATGSGSAVVAEASSADASPYKNTAPQLLKNNYAVPMKVTYTDSVTGELLMTRTLQPGEVLTFSLRKQGDNAVTETFELLGDTTIKGMDQFGNEQTFISLGGNQWENTIPDSSFATSRPTWEAATSVNSAVPPSSLQPVVGTPPANVPSSSGGAAGGATTVVQGNSGAIQFSSTASSGGATDSTLREASGAIVTKLGDIEGLLGKQGTQPVTLNATGIESRIDTTNTKMDEVKALLTLANEREEARDTPADQNAIVAAWNASTAAAKTAVTNEFQTQWNNVVGEPQPAAHAAPQGGSDWPSFNMPILGQIEFSPDAIPWLTTAMNIARELVLWLLVMAFITSALHRVNHHTLQVASTPQVNTTISGPDMVPVAGQALGWLKGTVTAVGMISVVVVCFGAAVGVINSNINFAGIAGGVGSFLSGGDVLTNTLGSSGSNPFWSWALEFFPVGAFFSLITAEAALALFMAPIFLLASFLVRVIRA